MKCYKFLLLGHEIEISYIQTMYFKSIRFYDKRLTEKSPSPASHSNNAHVTKSINMSQSNKDSEPQTIEASVVEIEQIRPSAVLKSKPQFSNSKSKVASLVSQSSLALSQEKNRSNKIIRTSVPKVNCKPSQYSVTQHTQNSGRGSGRNSLYNGENSHSQKRFISPSPTVSHSLQSSSRLQNAHHAPHSSNINQKGMHHMQHLQKYGGQQQPHHNPSKTSAGYHHNHHPSASPHHIAPSATPDSMSVPSHRYQKQQHGHDRSSNNTLINSVNKSPMQGGASQRKGKENWSGQRPSGHTHASSGYHPGSKKIKQAWPTNASGAQRTRGQSGPVPSSTLVTECNETARISNMDGKQQHQLRNSSQPEKETIGHEAEVKGSHNMKTKQNIGQNQYHHDSKAKKKYQQQQMQASAQQVVNDQRSSMHLQGQANQGGFSSSTTQRQFENAQAVNMMASSNSNVQPNSKSNSKAGNFFRRNTSNQSGKAHGAKNQSIGSQNAISTNQGNNHSNLVQQHYPMHKQGVVGSRQSSGGGHSAHQQHQMNHAGPNNSSRMIQQNAPQSHYNPKSKIISIGQSTSPKVSPKNIKELLKFRVGQSGQGTANVTNQSVASQNPNMGSGMIGQSPGIGASHNYQHMQKGSQMSNASNIQAAGGGVLFQEGIRNRKQTVGTTYSQNQEIHHFQQNQHLNSSGHHSNVAAQKLGYDLNSSQAAFSSGKYSHNNGGHGQQASPIMPGNGNSQVNYQQRKSLKKTISNEQYKLQNQGGPNSVVGNTSGTGIQFHQASSVGINTRGNSLNSSQNEPVKITNNNSSQLQYQQQPLTQNFIQRPTTNGNSHGGGVIQQAPNTYHNNGMQSQIHPQYQQQSNHASGGANNGHQSNYRLASGGNRQSQGQNSGNSNQPQMNQRGYNPANAGHKQNMPQHQFQGHPQQYSAQNLISNEQLQEQIQKLIKNNKKHFSKDQSTEELHKYLKQVLTQYIEGNSGQFQIQGGSNVNDKQGFNDLINELIKINQPLLGVQGQVVGPNSRMRSGKDRAHSEKTGQKGGAGGVGAGYGHQHPSGPHQGIHQHQQDHGQYAQQKGYPHSSHINPHHTQNSQNQQAMPHQQNGKQSAAMAGSSSTQKKAKMQKPTINLSINNNVQNVIVTPLGNGAGQYPNSSSNQQNAAHNTPGHILINNQGQQMNGSQHPQNQNPNAINPNQPVGNGHQMMVQAKQKRTSSEDNVNIQQQMNLNYMRNNAAAPQQIQGHQRQMQPPHQQVQYQQNNNVYPQKSGTHESPLVLKHRKNLPSLNNQHDSAASGASGSLHKGNVGNSTRGISNDSSVPMAIQIQNQHQFTNGSGFLPGGSRENSQASGSHQKMGHGQTPGSVASQGQVLYTAGSNQKSDHLNNDLINKLASQINIQNSNQNLKSSKNSSNNEKTTANHSQASGVQATGTSAERGHGSQSSSHNATTAKPTTKVDDTILQERDNLIKYIKSYIKKNNELPPTTLNFYKFVKLIGKGAFGKVTLGVHKLTGKQVAIKTIEKNYMQDEFSKRKVFQEVYLLKKIKHSNVIRLLEVFESSKHLLMVMEYAGGGDLLRLIKRKGKLQESDAKFIFKQIAYGLAHIHCRSVIHRDIKLDNILLDCEKGVKICDFGVSKIIKKGQVIQEQCGTPAYLAPEIIIDKGYEGFFVDIWSLGVLLFAMLCGTVPFKAGNLEDLHKLILKGEFTFPCDLSTEAQALVRGMIQLEPKARLTVPQILSHAWLKETNEDESEEEEEEKDEGDGNKDGKEGGAMTGGGQGNKNDIDLKNIQGNVNYVNVDNLFYHENYKIKLSYTDYCCITEDFSTENIDEEALQVCDNFGFPRQFVIKCLNRGDINHATACYYLLTNAG